MTSILEKDITTLRKAFALYCNLLGLKQDTCLALILILDSKILLVAIMKYMAELDDDRVQDRLTWDEITTLVVNKAVETKDMVERKIYG